MKCYMLTWARGSFGAAKATVTATNLTDFFDTDSDIVNWRTDAGALFLVTEADIWKIRDRLCDKFPGLSFLLTRVDEGGYSGFASKQTWDFLSKPKPA